MNTHTRVPSNINLIPIRHANRNIRLHRLVLRMPLGPALDGPAVQAVGGCEPGATRTPRPADGGAGGVFVKVDFHLEAHIGAVVVEEAVGGELVARWEWKGRGCEEGSREV